MTRKIKRVTLIFLLLISFLPIALASAAPENNKEKDVLYALLNPRISNALVGYYGVRKLYDLSNMKILSIEPLLPEGSFVFRVVVVVETFTGPHNPPYGRDKITLRIDTSDVSVEKFEHTDI